ncbi:hypothetical protein BHM03_00022729 [Ensete ventricosum]|nr:hypothetical protein BHM03_00022729 [Ensete ventricosum]
MSVRILHSLSPSPHNMKFTVCTTILLCDNMNMCIFFQVERSFDLSRVLKCFFLST